MPAGIYERKYKPAKDRFWEKVDKPNSHTPTVATHLGKIYEQN